MTIYSRDSNNIRVKMSKAVHVLVLDSFQPFGYEEGDTVDHFDQCKHNNKMENLSFMTLSDNIRNQFGTRANKKDNTSRGIHRVSHNGVFKRFKTKRFDRDDNLIQRSFSHKVYGSEEMALMAATCWRGVGQYTHTVS